jgi:hypothetical protein
MFQHWAESFSSPLKEVVLQISIALVGRLSTPLFNTFHAIIAYTSWWLELFYVISFPVENYIN